MIVISSPVSLVIPPSKLPRTPGVHLSSLIRCIAMENGYLEAEADEEFSIMDRDIRGLNLPPEAIARICMGLAWEQFYIETQLPEVIDHPGEIEFDGVYMTPDGEELASIFIDTRNRYTPKIHEIKHTSKSMNTVGFWPAMTYDTSVHGSLGPVGTQWMWLAQLKGYCKAKGTRYAALHVLFSNGDYSWPQRPYPARYDIEFTQEELDENWALLDNYRRYRLKEDHEAPAVVDRSVGTVGGIRKSAQYWKGHKP